MVVAIGDSSKNEIKAESSEDSTVGTVRIGGTRPSILNHDAVAIAQNLEKIAQQNKRAKKKRREISNEFMNFSQSRAAILIAIGSIAIYLALGTTVFGLWIEDWDVVDATYYTVATFTTVGYGDLYPVTAEQRIFGMFFVVIGIMAIGGVFLGIVSDAASNSISKRMDQSTSQFINKFKLDEDDDDDNIDEKAITETIVAILTHVLLLALIFVPAIIIGHYEGWKFYESIYYAVVTATTVGYGDLSPQLTGTRIAAIFYLPLCVTVMASLFGKVTSIYMDKKARDAECEFLNRQLTREQILKMDVNENGTVDSEEFLVFMLLAMGKVKPELVEEIYEAFNNLDKDNSGALELSDIASIIYHEKLWDKDDDMLPV